MTDTQYPKAGDVWTVGDHTVEWVKDANPGEPLTYQQVLLDGEPGVFGQRVPDWLLQDLRQRGITVTTGAEAVLRALIGVPA